MNTMNNNEHRKQGSRLFGTHSQKLAAMRPIAALQSWDLNPREDEEKGMKELGESLIEEGQLDDVHVLDALGAEVILRGHRRVRAMREIGWTECRQVLHKFSDMRDAYRFAIIDHGQTVPLNAHEKLTMVENANGLGLNGDDLASTLGLNRETVTKYHELALNLPQVARSALSEERMSMHTAELLLAVKDAKDRRAAAQMILCDMETGEPMAHGQAKAYIEAHYVLPEKWRREWQETEVKLKKKFKVADGHHYVQWSDRRNYTMGESGQPEPGFEFATTYMPKDKDGRTYGHVAAELGVPIYVVAAPLHKDGYVAMVQVSMLRDAMSVAPAGGGEDDRVTGGQDDRVTESGSGDETSGHPVTVSPDHLVTDDRDDGMAVRMRRVLSGIYEALLMNPTDVMTKEPWLPLQEYLATLTTDVDAGALEAWLGITTKDEALRWIADDKKNRAHLRTTLMLLLCAESDASDEPERRMREVAAALGVTTEAES